MPFVAPPEASPKPIKSNCSGPLEPGAPCRIVTPLTLLLSPEYVPTIEPFEPSTNKVFPVSENVAEPLPPDTTGGTSSPPAKLT